MNLPTSEKLKRGRVGANRPGSQSLVKSLAAHPKEASQAEKSACAPIATHSRDYMPQLDSVRALAIGLVFIEHLGGPYVRYHFPLSAGALGVDLFFVLSGFLISGLLFADFDRSRDHYGPVLGHFFLRRITRLLPAFYGTVLILCIFRVGQIREFWMWHALYASNYLVAAGGPLTVFWSLSTEEQFYLVMPFVLLLFANRYRKLVGIGLITFGFVSRCLAWKLGVAPRAFDASLAGALEVLGAGVLLGAFCYSNGQRVFAWLDSPFGRVFDGIAAAALLTETCIFYIFPIEGIERYLTFSITSAAFLGWLVVRAARGFSGPIGTLAENSAIRYVGKISYGLYLIHSFIPAIMQRPFVEAVTGRLPLPMLAIASAVASFIIASFSWHFFERPLLRLGRRLTRLERGRAELDPAVREFTRWTTNAAQVPK